VKPIVWRVIVGLRDAGTRPGVTQHPRCQV